MALLASANYDPAVVATQIVSSLRAMTALDTTNLRLTFTAPSNGKVLVRIRVAYKGSTTQPTILLGIIESSPGSGVKARLSPIGGISGTSTATTYVPQEALFAISGLTPGQSYTWDAAYGVEIIGGIGGLGWGGPDDAAGNDAYGGVIFEVWEAPNLLASALYDPAGAVSKATTSLLAMTVLDTTNLRLNFTVPASGKVLVRMRSLVHGASTFPQILLGVMEGATVKGRQASMGTIKTGPVATAQMAQEAEFVVTGLTPGANLNWDAAYAVQVVVALTGLKYGGPNNTTANDAFGGFLYEIWDPS